MRLTNNPSIDAFADDEYQSQEFIKQAEREREQRQKPIATSDDLISLGRAISTDLNINPLFKNLFK